MLCANSVSCKPNVSIVLGMLPCAAAEVTVVIDVVRAATAACCMVERGVEQIIPVETVNAAWALKRRIPDALLAGESGGRRPEGFDWGNSPYEILNSQTPARRVIHRSSNGTPCLLASQNSPTVLLTAFVNLHATVEFLRKRQVATVVLRASGGLKSEEDLICAKAIERALLEDICPTTFIPPALAKSPRWQALLEQPLPWRPLEDIQLCAELNRHHFVLCLERSQEGFSALHPRNQT